MDAVIIFKVELGIERVARAAQGPALPPKQGSSVFATLKANFISTFAHPGAGLHSCSAGGAAFLFGGERESPDPHPSHPAAGFTTFPRKSRLWVVTSQSSSRKGLLKWA